jgi:N-acyl-D-aspartate/D-glutamate deacylase
MRVETLPRLSRARFYGSWIASGPIVLILAQVVLSQDGAGPNPAKPDGAAEAAVDCDVLLKGGLILDGSGAEGTLGDVAIRDERIVAVGDFQLGRAGRTIDCRGLVVAPGFIDLHSHSDGPIVKPATRGNVNFVTQGCTTVVTGNCGGGPINVDQYFEQLDESGAGTNIIHLLPQGALRNAVLGRENREPTPAELTRMCELADKAMQDGAWGMSTGLIYVPSSYAKTDEIIEIAKVVSRHGGVYASHIRGEGLELLDAISEAIAIGREANLPVHVSHFKASGRDAWGTIRAAAELIEQARREGQTVTADQYPYIASSTSLEATLIPTWASAGGRSELHRRLRDEAEGKRIRETIAKRLALNERIVISAFDARRDFVGRELREIASAENRDVVELVVEMHLQGSPRCVKFGMSEEDVRFAMQLPWVATASDGSAMVPSSDRPHPRSFGTFTRKLGMYAREEGVISLAHAVRSGSGLPADILKLQDRGYVRPGVWADVIVFDPQTVSDRATFDDPFQYSEGMRWVFVNGVPAIHEGTPTGALAGRALRHVPEATK